MEGTELVMDVNKLPANLQSQLKSDLVARNISNCVIELVENAIDANATCIAVRINLETFHLQVVDNGEGLTKEQLDSVGERFSYSTSRNNDSSFKRFGYRGESLASIKNVSSRLLIVSRARGEDTTYCKVFEGNSASVGKAVHQRASRGTTIVVENIFGNIPVRQRCTKSRVELQIIKRYIQATALMFPAVNFSIRDDTKNSDIIKIQRTKSTRTTFMTLFPGAVRERSSLLNLTSKHENLTIKAMISKEVCNTDQLQFIFINKRYIPNCEIQEYLNQLLSKIDTSKEKRSSSRVAYVLNLSCPRDEYDMTFESGERHVQLNQWLKVKKCLLDLVKQLTNDESILDEKIPVKKETEIASKDAFRKLNAAHTVFGLPANRAKNETESHEVHVIDDSSSESSQSVSLLKNMSPERCKAEITDVRIEENKTKVSLSFKLPNKGRRTVKKPPKNFCRSPRLCDQGAKLEYKKSPAKKMRTGVENRPEEAKTCSKNVNAVVNESASSEYAWIWKLPPKKAREVDLSERPKTKDPQNNSVIELKDNRCRRAPEKVKKYKNLNKDVKYIERCQSMEALSRRRMVQKPGAGRISKKKNNYFDVNPLEKKDLISRYGNVRKNVDQHEKIDGMVRLSDLETEKTWEVDDFEDHTKVNTNDRGNVEWTATSTEEGKKGMLRKMIFDDRRSPELECFNENMEFIERPEYGDGLGLGDANCTLIPTMPVVGDESTKNITLSLNRIKKCSNANEKNTNVENFELIPTLPASDDESKDSLPLKKVSKRLNFDEKKYEIMNKRRSESFKFNNSQTLKKPTEIIKKDTNPQVVDYKRKVSEWISKMPPNDCLEIVEDAYDSVKLTPTKHSHEADQIANDFETKAKISKTENDADSEFNGSTPEKSKSLKFDNFKLENKWKSSTSKSRIQKYMMQSKVRHRLKTKSPKLLFNWNAKTDTKKSQIDDILHSNTNPNPENDNDRKENSKQCDQLIDASNKDSKLAEEVSWNCVDDCDHFKANDSGEANEVLSDVQNIAHSSQKSGNCPSDCECKCHRSSRSTNRILTNSIENHRKSGMQSTGDIANDTIILKNTASCPAADNDISMASNHNQINEVMSQGREEQIPAESEVANQHFSAHSDNPSDSKYFTSRSELVEKLKFKMKSKFLESSSAVDIPKGMLQVRRTATNVEKLSSNEKKAVEELVKPYSMQSHITVDDYGNSCLRIFPFLKKNAEKLENADEPLNCNVIFTKSDICSFEFMAQVSNEFILAKAELRSTKIPLLILLDQHAVDERIRVERLSKEYTRDSRWLSSSINPPIHLSVPFNYSSLFTDYQSNFEEFGLFYEFNSVNRNNEEKLLVSCTKVPTCLYNKAKRENANNYHPVLKRLIETLMKEMLKKFTTQETLVYITPKELQNVVNDEACRGAVKFGDELSPQVCTALLEGLKFCDLPFQCAHGRPSVIPLTNLNLLMPFKKEIPDLSLDKMKNALCL